MEKEKAYFFTQTYCKLMDKETSVKIKNAC